jgi:hypothetical protein
MTNIQASSLLQQAQALLAGDTFTLVQARELASLEAQAKGQEAELIAELWEAVYGLADEALLNQLQDEGIL